MARANPAMIRRALAALLQEVKGSAGQGADMGTGYGMSGGALAGLVGGGMASEDGEAAVPGAIAGMAGGGALGAGVGGALGGAMGMRGGVSAMRRALMENLDEGPSRVLSTIPRRSFSPDELGEYGDAGPIYGSGEHSMDRGRANPMVEMNERQAMRDMLRKMRQERRYATDPDEAEELDLQIALLQRALGE